MSTTPTVTHNDHHIPIPINDFRGFIANVLRSLDWREIQTPRDYKRVTAIQQDEMRGHSTWALKFKLKITYKKASDGNTILNYELTEEKSKLKKNCQDKLMELMKTVHELAQDAVATAAEQERPTTYGSAKFADEEELRAKGYIQPSSEPNRLLLAPWGKEFVTVPVMFTNMHGMVCGPTGAGKSSGFFIPNLVYRTQCSMVVTEATAGDETPDLYAKTAGWRQFKGSKIYFFNPDHARGTRINPLDKLKYVTNAEFPQVADELANLVIVNTSPPGAVRSDPIWDKSEKHLLWIMIMHVARSSDPKLAHFGAIREILRKSDKQIKQILQDSNSSIAREEFDSFLHHSSENFRHGVFSGLLQRLNPWLNAVVQTMTATTDLNLDELENQNFSFYLSVPSRQKHVKPIAALIFNFILDLALKKKFKFPPAMMLDEFTNFGAIPGIDEALSIIRKRDLPVILGFQTQSQLTNVYGPIIADQITSQLATRIFFRPRKPRDAEDLSDALDDQTIIDKRTDDRGNTTIREIGKPLMSVRDIANLPPNEVIIMTESTNPLKIERYDYNTCPPPIGFDPPELVEHELMQVETLNDATLEMKAKTAKEKAQKDLDFTSRKSEMEATIVTAEEKHDLDPLPQVGQPQPEVQPGPQKEEPAPAPTEKKKKKVRTKVDSYDDWDVPG
jgi:type IV secretory pathway TraG/TraD family ATPase VirD4